MTDNKQYPYGGAPYPNQEVGQAPPYPGTVPFPMTAGMANPGYGIPPTGFAGYGMPAQGVGLMGAPPPMGFHMPAPTQPAADDGPKNYSGESGSSYNDLNGFDFSEKTIRRAFIRYINK